MNTIGTSEYGEIFAGETDKLILHFQAIVTAAGAGGFTIPGDMSSEFEMHAALKRGIENGKQTRHDVCGKMHFVMIAPLEWDIDAVTTAFFAMLEEVNQLWEAQ